MLSSSHCCDDPADLPILNSNFNSRSKDEGAALSARDSHGDSSEGKSRNYMPQSRSDISKQPTTRDYLDDFMTAIANVNARETDVEREAHAHGSSDKAFGVVERDVPDGFTTESVAHPINEEDLLSAESTILSGRDLSSRQDIQTRSFLSNVIKALEGGYLRRDFTHDQLLAARDGAKDLVNSIIGNRDSKPEQQMQPGEVFATVLNALGSSRRDVASDELAARDDWEDLVKMLNTRELAFKPDMQARGLFTGFLS
jgi:hypothetical protein